MPEDYPSAAARHWTESEFLTSQAHWQEAAYLAGYAAECALKVLVNRGGVAGRKLGHDLVALSGHGLELAVLFNPLLRRCHTDLGHIVAAGLPAWSETQRYDRTGALPEAEYQSIAAQAAAVARAVLVTLVLDGDLPEVPA